MDRLSLGPGPLLGRTIMGNGIVAETSIKYQVLPYEVVSKIFWTGAAIYTAVVVVGGIGRW